MTGNDQMNRGGRARVGPDLEARFDAELRRAAQALVTEDLPRGVLDEALSPGGRATGSLRARRSMPAYAGLAAVLVLLLATAVALVPGGSPPGSPTPPPASSPPPTAQPSASTGPTSGAPGAFRTTAEIRADFERLEYACVRGNVLLPTGPSPSAPVLESAVCTAPTDAGPYKAVVVASEDAGGRVVELHAKADLTVADTASSREAIAAALAKAVAIAVSGQDAANELAAWLIGAVAALPAGSSNSTERAGFALKLVRGDSGGYLVTLRPR